MDLKNKKKIKRVIIEMVVALGVMWVANFVIDTVSLPVSNEITVAQLNGGDAEMVANRASIAMTSDGLAFVNTFGMWYLLFSLAQIGWYLYSDRKNKKVSQ